MDHYEWWEKYGLLHKPMHTKKGKVVRRILKPEEIKESKKYETINCRCESIPAIVPIPEEFIKTYEYDEIVEEFLKIHSSWRDIPQEHILKTDIYVVWELNRNWDKFKREFSETFIAPLINFIMGPIDVIKGYFTKDERRKK